jgi:hypothetical protein
MSAKRLYKIVFISQGQVYEIYARSVGHGALFGFVEVEKLVFGERSSVVVDPSEEGGNVAQFPVPIFTPGGESKS